MLRRHPILASIAALALAAQLVACGDNVFKSTEAEDAPEDAALALERGDPSKAIEILEAALLDDPENPQLTSLLSAAYAQRAGVEPLSFAQGIGGSDADSGSDTSNDGLVSLFGIMPEATVDSLADIDYAVTLVASIPAESRMAGDPFKYAIYQTASMVMHLKILDTDGDGVLSIEEIVDLSDTSATGLLNQLASAQATLAAQGADSATMLKASETLARFQTQIDASEGATPEDQLRNYMATTP